MRSRFGVRSGWLLGAAILAGCGESSHTPLICAARNGDTRSIAALIGGGADPDLPGGVNGWTPLMHAIHKARGESVRALLAGGADPNRGSRDGVTPLMMAAGYGFDEMVTELLDRGADPHTRHPDGSTALDFAVSGVPDIDRFTVRDCQAATVKVLLARAPDVRLQNPTLSRFARLLKHGGGCTEMRASLARAR